MKNIGTLSVVAVIVLSGCRTAKFSTDSGINRGANVVPTQAPWQPEEPFASPLASPVPGVSPPSPSTPVPTPNNCVPNLPPVHVVIVIDKSGSMSNELKGVREGLGYFTTQLQNKIVPGFGKPIPDLRYSLVGYEDVINVMGGPWAANNPIVQQNLNSWFAKVNSGASDTPEGGIMAIREAFKLLSTQPQPFVPVVVLITDSLSHDGSGKQDQRYGSFDSLNPYLQTGPFKKLMLFSAPNKGSNGSGDFSDQTDRTYRSGWAQMDGLRNHIRAVSGATGYVGENFIEVRNFKSSTLGDVVAARIAENLVRCP